MTPTDHDYLDLAENVSCAAGLVATIVAFTVVVLATMAINWLITRREKHDNE
jgi:hypothetical protein